MNFKPMPNSNIICAMISFQRPKLRLKRGWLRPKHWLGTNVPYNNNGLVHAVSPPKKKEKKYTEKSSFCRNLS
jgi:hypothetical protein